MVEARGVNRSAWVNGNATSLKDLLDPAAERMGEALQRGLTEQLPPEAAGMAGLMTQLGPLLQGAQIGQVLGFLAQRVFGPYDVAIPRPAPAALLFVVPNLAAFERDWSLDPTEFRTFAALHEVAHRIEFAHPWARERFNELVEDFLSTITIDVDRIQERLQMLDPADPEGLQRALGEEDGGMFGTVLDDEQRLKLARIQAFMAAAEGYGDHVTREVGRELLGTYPRIAEAMRRHREGEETDPVFERLLGIDVRREHFAQGQAFCDTVVELTDEATLARMWESADAMPSLPEIQEPRLWLARTV
jgi:putative hydrolase